MKTPPVCSSTSFGNNDSDNSTADAAIAVSFFVYHFVEVSAGRFSDSFFSAGMLKVITTFSSFLGSDFFCCDFTKGSLYSNPVAINVIPILSLRLLS